MGMMILRTTTGQHLSMTLVEFSGEDNHWTASNRLEPVEVSQEYRDEEEHTSGSVKRLKEFVNSISDL